MTACVSGQDLESLQKAAEAKGAEWDALAKTLEGKLVRMLPCDARVKTSVEEVNRASDARIAALSEYLKAAAAQVQADDAVIAKAVAAQETAMREVDSDRAEADQERIAVDAQLADLDESLKKRVGLLGAEQSLTAVAQLVRQRVSGFDTYKARESALLSALRELQQASAARKDALQKELSTLAAEATAWSEYYAARIARSATECSITNQTEARPRPQRKKR
jgi:hypothetical protein